MEACENCRFWDHDNTLTTDENDQEVAPMDVYSECRRYPPKPRPEGQMGFTQGFTVFPITYAHQWCGEWRGHDPSPLVCKRCGVDRSKAPCPIGITDRIKGQCPMNGVAA